MSRRWAVAESISGIWTITAPPISPGSLRGRFSSCASCRSGSWWCGCGRHGGRCSSTAGRLFCSVPSSLTVHSARVRRLTLLAAPLASRGRHSASRANRFWRSPCPRRAASLASPNIYHHPLLCMAGVRHPCSSLSACRLLSVH